MNKEKRSLLIKTAYDAILDEFSDTSLINKSKLLHAHPFLTELRAVFITLFKIENNQKQLRGCIGSITPRRTLLDDIIHNAKAAAFNDSRFSPVSEEELENIKLEISILSIPQAIQYNDLANLKQIIKIGEHGVILEKKWKRATFLPSVWEKLPEFDVFFSHLCQKAGLETDCLKSHPYIKIYTVNKISE